jgi:hypothetical protein
MSSQPLLQDSDSGDEGLEMTAPIPEGIFKTTDDHPEEQVIPGGDGPALADAGVVPSRKQRISDLFTILCAGCALISDGYANSLMTLVNVILTSQYPKQYVSSVSTRVSNALLVGEICGQITIGYVYPALLVYSYFMLLMHGCLACPAII